MMDLFVFDHSGGTLVCARMSGQWGRKECLHLLNLFQEVTFPPGSQVILDFARARHIDYRAVPMLMNFAARVERARKEAKLRRAPPTKPLDSDAVRKRGAKSHARPNATTPPR